MIVSLSTDIYGGVIQVISDVPPQALRMKNKWNSNLCMSLTLVIKESKWQISLDPGPTPEIITDIKNNKYVGCSLKVMVTEGGYGGRIIK